MAVKIRLQRKGRKQRPFYHIVIADARSPRDGRFIERIGSYNPLTKPATIEIDRDKAFDWLMKGAQPTDTVRAMLRFKGVYYRKHLMRGVKKGALTQEEADKKYHEWVEVKEAKIAERFAQTEKENAEFNAKVAGAHITVKKDEKKPAGLEIAKEPTEAPVEEVAEVENTITEEVTAEVETTKEAAAETEATAEEVTAAVETVDKAVAETEAPAEEVTEEEPVAENATEEEKEG